MLFISHSPEVHKAEGTVTGTLTGRFAISLVFDGGVIVLDPSECATVLPSVQRFVERHHQQEGTQPHG